MEKLETAENLGAVHTHTHTHTYTSLYGSKGEDGQESKSLEADKEKRKRITYIDTAKAIAIFLTILSHSGLNGNPINQFICSFHMPLFFFLTGWVQKNKKLTGVKEWANFILKKIYVLIVPYILYALIYSTGSNLDVYKDIFYGTIFSLKRAGAMTALWFIPCMFVSVILYQIIINIKESIKNKQLKYGLFFGILILCGVISSYFNYYNAPKLGIPFSLNIALTAVLFMFAGNYISKLYNFLLNKFNLLENKKIILPISILILVAGCFLCKLNVEAFENGQYAFGVVMGEAWYGNYLIFMINAIICSIGITLLSMVIDNKVLQFFGKNTLIILYFHIQALKLSKQYITFKLPNGTYTFFVNSILAFLEMGLIIPIINKFFPNLAGKVYDTSKKIDTKSEKTT